MRRHLVAGVLHRAALRAYPAPFRCEFGGELVRIFEARLDQAGGRGAAAVLAGFLIADALISGAAERMRRRHQEWAWPRHDSAARTRSQTMTWDSVRADVRLALRQARRAPLFAALTVASLALGIGANSAMFGVVQAVLLRPLPYGDPGALVMIWSDNTKNGEKNNPVSPANYEAFKTAPSLAAVEAMYSFLTPVQVRIGTEPEPALVSQVSPGMFTLLGRAPAVGRKFDDEGAPEGAVLSHQFWQRRFGGDPAIVGRPLTLSGAGASAVIPIIGVMPADFVFPYGSMLGPSGFTRSQLVDMWWPISRQRDPRVVDASGQPNRAIHYFGVVGRLAAGASIDRARRDLSAIAEQRAADYPDTNMGWGVTLRPLHEQTVGSLRPALVLLMGGVGVVLLITCINVANVLLARAAGRGRDLSIRSALGASRRRLIQQTLIESMLLSVAGGVAGLGVMLVATRAILAAAPSNLPRLGEVAPGAPVVLFALGLSLMTGVIVGLLPATAAANSKAHDSLRDGTRATASAGKRRTRSALIVAEVALAMTLTVCGGLLLRSFISVLGVDPGFKADQLLTMQVSVPPRYSSPESRLTFYDELEARLKALPGVVDVGGTTRLPLGSTNVTTMLDVEGRAVPRAEMPEVEMRRAVFDYFSAMGIPVVRGRVFTRDDTASVPQVAVVNAALAARVFPGEDAVGRRVRFNSEWMTIIGVVGNVKHGSLEEVPKPELYITYRQGPPVGPYLVIRTRDDAAALAGSVRQAIRELGADPPTDMRTMEAVRSNSVAARRFVLLLVGTFGALALGLAALGVFGVITLIAAERTTEVGIRMALGATPSQVLKLVLGQAITLTVGGVALGAVAAFLLGPVIRTQLFGVGVADPLTYVAVAIALVGTGGLAALVPARRAMSVDPVQALRN
ncbi:MAG TPA: ABC transporter permease [Vicinamibacterales bacterium]|nr:ABC transporter permease [Vicinamibacterales bacterium]